MARPVPYRAAFAEGGESPMAFSKPLTKLGCLVFRLHGCLAFFRVYWQSLPLVIFSSQPEETSAMPTRNISLTAEQDAFVEKLVKAGEYQNASEAVRDALRALEQRRREDELKLRALRMQVKAGIDAIKRGDFAEIEESDLDDYLEGLEVTSRKRTR